MDTFEIPPLVHAMFWIEPAAQLTLVTGLVKFNETILKDRSLVSALAGSRKLEIRTLALVVGELGIVQG
jgi:hypothetical protein